MDESDWRDLFERFHIRVKRDRRWFFNTGRVPQHQGEDIPGLYLNRNRHHQIYLSARQEDEGCYPDRLWDRLDAGSLKQKDRLRINVAPKLDMEEEAMDTLLHCLGLV